METPVTKNGKEESIYPFLKSLKPKNGKARRCLMSF